MQILPKKALTDSRTNMRRACEVVHADIAFQMSVYPSQHGFQPLLLLYRKSLLRGSTPLCQKQNLRQRASDGKLISTPFSFASGKRRVKRGGKGCAFSRKKDEGRALRQKRANIARVKQTAGRSGHNGRIKHKGPKAARRRRERHKRMQHAGINKAAVAAVQIVCLIANANAHFAGY